MVEIPSKQNQLNYKKVRDEVKKRVRENKRQYFDKHFSKCNDSKQMFPIFNIFCGKKRKDTIELTSDELNDFFVNIGSKLANISRISRVLKRCIFRPADVNEIENIILALKNKKTCGHDGFSNEMIKLCSPVISPYLVQCFNNCIDEGVFPEFLKNAKVIPLHKSGSKKDANNYRPISLLTSFNKIFEKMIFNRMICFIEKYGLLAKQQYGFRKD